MRRIGVKTENELLNLYKEIQSTDCFTVDGIFTHFATADEENEAYFIKQVNLFQQFIKLLPEKPRIVHVS